MEIVFYLSAFVAVFATFMVITNDSAVHALLYRVVSLLSAAMIFFPLGAPFAALLEVIVYSGAILVLFLFVGKVYVVQVEEFGPVKPDAVRAVRFHRRHLIGYLDIRGEMYLAPVARHARQVA